MNPPPSPVRLLAAVLGAAALAVALVALGHPVPARVGTTTAFAGAALLCLRRARTTPTERGTWTRLALGAALLGGNALYRLVQLSLDLGGPWSVVPAVLTTAAFPVLYSGLVRWNRGSRLLQRRYEAWTGVAAAALVLAALEAWTAHGGPLADRPQTARLVLELPASASAVLLLAAVLTPLSAGVRDPRGWLTTAATVVVVVPVWARALGISGADWAPLPLALAAAVLACAAARRPRPAPPGRRDGSLTAGEALAMLLGVVAVLAVAATRVSALVVVLAGFTTAVCGVRLLHGLRGLTQLAEVRQQATTDELTGTANRRALLHRIAQVTGTGEQVCLAVLDVDDFGTINDGLGSRGGDQLLVEVAGRLQGALRATCVLGRLGGDDFAVVAATPPGMPPTDPLELGARLTAALAGPFTVGGLRLHVTASMGLAATTADDGEQLFVRAATALRESKRLRTGPVLHDPARHDDTSGQLRLVEELRLALVRDELVLHLQPQVDVGTGALHGVEALVRWQHPARGLLGPASFVPLAEAHGLIGPLTERVLELALAQLARWRADGVRLRVSVNLSASNLLDEALPERLLGRLLHHRVDPADLVLEVTENVFAGDSPQVRGVLTALAGLGAGLSIDDYGTGWSSLGYLRRLPVGELKLDRSFTADLRTDHRTAAIVGSTIDLAHRLGMRVVAEGVEDEPTLHELERLGCDLSQGYLHARPLPADELAGWVAARAASPGALTAG
ncbi:putative bifunctional diguanylate cyclase/phosphodiesterase [Klenkia brasiliensis]|uniref:Diguanylate cyclase (GGDEF) domain-containing protein n=1 Tax=Klenkia brasiliensis TaxID=333142 RepID=A0A1G7XWH4_9ACTN|nr:bifunctional diguanylate cyclase/phosphodiesterase [Klenkia brasiliensis]SDG88572.1 diguanylate cyclase (GGDEF) domain-containing protein [Klenkia brasiliensis]